MKNRTSTHHGGITLCEECPAHLTHFKRVRIYWNQKEASFKDSGFIISYLKALKRACTSGMYYEVIWYYQEDGDEVMDMGWDLACLLEMRFIFKNYLRENLMTFTAKEYLTI